MKNFAGGAGVDRRQLLAGLGAAILLPARGAAAAASPLRALLDRMAREGAGTPLPRGLDAADAAIAAMVRQGLARDAALRNAFPFGKADASSPYVLSQRHGAWMDLGSGRASVEAAGRLDAETERLRADAARGIAPPAFILDAVIESERALLGRTLPPAAASALQRQRTALEALRRTASDVPGVWRLPGGSAYYPARLRCATGTDWTPEQLEARVWAEMGRLLVRADRLLNGLGLACGSVGARLRALKARPQYLFANDAAGRDRAVAGMNAALDRLRAHLPAWFNGPVEAGSSVRRMAAADEAAGKRGYREPAAAGRPGVYYPDLGDVHARPAWTLTTVAFHETIPGHLLQLRRQADADPHPLQVRHAPGYAEGWAIYAESLADRMGLLSPVEQLGFVQSLLFRLARAAADIGLHHRRWDRARALRFLEDTVGFELFFPFGIEVDRYCAEPGGFAGDAAAALTLTELGRRRRPGAPVRAFHDIVLNRGPLSVEALRTLA